MMKMRRWIGSGVLGLAALASAVGCGGGTAGQGVSGTVRLDGQPLSEGLISFAPQEGGGTGATARIRDGSYSVPRSEGMTPGAYRVEISSVRATGEQIFNQGDNVMEDEVIETIPEAYNVGSTLTATVEAGGANTLDFDLRSSEP